MWTNSPQTSVGERRPCGALLQPVVAIWLRMQSVVGSLRRQPSGVDGGAGVTPTICYRIANPFLRGHRQVGSSAAAAPPCQCIEGAQRLAQAGQNSAGEGKAKSQSDWIPTDKEFRGESRA